MSLNGSDIDGSFKSFSISTLGGVNIGEKDEIGTKTYGNSASYVTWMATFTARTSNGWCDVSKNECLNEPVTVDTHDHTTTEDLKLVIDFGQLTLVHGLWWSTGYSPNHENGYIRR